MPTSSDTGFAACAELGRERGGGVARQAAALVDEAVHDALVGEHVRDGRPQVVHPPVRELADVGRRGAEGVEREREHHRVEVAVAQHPPGRDVDERVVVHRVELELRRHRGAARRTRGTRRGPAARPGTRAGPGPSAGRRARTAGCRRGTRGCSSPRRAGPARAWRAGRPRRGPTGCRRSPRATRRARGPRPRRRARARSTSSAAWPIATPLAEITVRPSLGSSSIGARPGRRQRGATRHDLAVHLGVAAPDEHLRDRRHVHQVRRADRAGRGHDRVDPGVEQVDERLRHRPARARAAAGDAVEPGGHRGPHHRGGERLADGALVRPDDERLQLAQRLARQRHVALVPEAGVQPVHERRAVHDAVDDGAAGLDHAPRVVVEPHPGAVRDRHQVVERELVRPDHDLGAGRRRPGRSVPGRRARPTGAASRAPRTAPPSRSSRGTPGRPGAG